MDIIPDITVSAIMTLPFFVAMVALNVILIKPLRLYLEERDQVVVNARAEQQQFVEDAEARLAELNAKMADNRKDVADIRAAARARAAEQHGVLIEAAREKAEGEIAAARTTIEAERLEARGSLEAVAKGLSRDIASQVLGRELEA
jgi:F0F1-type ATP synthase membrane subunit b/b'